MKIAVLSDIHDHIWNLEKVLNQAKDNTDRAIFCGDYCSPSTFKMATEKFKSAYCVWGNVDGEKVVITKEIYANNIKHVQLLGIFGEINIDGKKVAFTHYPDIAKASAHSKLYDAVFHGHTHEVLNEKVGNTLLLNPGAVCGVKNDKQSIATYAIYDTSTNSAEITEIK
jgi:putative phosphoesterase